MSLGGHQTQQAGTQPDSSDAALNRIERATALKPES